MTALAAQKLPDFAAARRNMIEGQIRPNKVRDERVLTVMENLPREFFVPERLMGVAYIDEDLPVGPGRYLLQPMVIARMLEEAQILPTDHILDLAPATGYSTAALAKLGAKVVAVESDADLQKKCEAVLGSLELRNIEVRLAPTQNGCKEAGPYDVIFINGAVEVLSEPLLGQLKEGGRLLVVARHYGTAHAAHTGEARLYQKTAEGVTYRSLFDANVALLPGFTAEAKFTF